MALGISYAGYRNGFPGKVHHAMEDGTPFELFTFGAATGPYGEPPEHTVGPGTYHPIGLSLSEVAEFYWRVKKYGFASNIQIDGADPPTTSYDLTTSGHVGQVDAEKEVNLIGNPGSPGVPSTEFVGGSIAGINGAFWAPAPDGEGGIIINTLIFSYQTPAAEPTHPVRYFDGKWWPSLAFEIGYEGYNNYYLRSDAIQDIGGEWPSALVATVDLLGHSIPLYHHYLTATGTLTVTAEEWWGYGGKFNTATGAKL